MNFLVLTALKVVEFLFGLLLLVCLGIFVDRGGHLTRDAAGMGLIQGSISTAIDIIATWYFFTSYWLVVAASVPLFSIWATRRGHLAAANAGSFLVPAIPVMMLDLRSFLGGLGAAWLLILAFDALLPLVIPIPGARSRRLGYPSAYLSKD